VSASRRLRGPLLLLLALHLPVLAAGWLAPYPPEVQYRELIWAPPVRPHLVDAEGAFHPWPFVYALRDHPERFGQYVEDESRRYPLRLLVRDEAGALRLLGVDAPARLALLGTDGLGRDVLARLLHGGRVSLFAGLLAATLSSLVGLVLGSVAGYRGGAADAALMRLSELFLALPWLYLLLAVRAFLPLDASPVGTFLVLVLVIGLVDWARPARLVRGVALSARERDFVRAARGFGASDRYLIRHHVAPLALPVLLTRASLAVPQYVLAEVTLSFVGLGIAEPAASWGGLLASLQEYHVLVSCGWMWSPALALVAVVSAYYWLADRLQHALG
jgi:peptide/nickel transport system permease protein